MDCLFALSETNCFNRLQDKLNNWKIEFECNCTELNISRCCELLELNAKIQGKLFELLGLCAIQGKLKGSQSKIRKQLFPYLGEEYLSQGLTSDIVMDILTDVSIKTKKASFKRCVENKRCNGQKTCVKERKRSCDKKFNNSKCVEFDSTTCGRSNPKEITEKLDSLRDMIMDLTLDKKKSANTTKKKENNTLTRSHSFSTLPEYIKEDNKDQRSKSGKFGNYSTSDIEEIRSDKYLQAVVGQYNDLFSESRVNSMNILKEHVDDHENNQRIIFALVMTTARNVVTVQRSLSRPFGLKSVSSQKLEFRKTISNSILKDLRARIIYELLHKRGSFFKFRLPHQFQFVEMEDFIDRTIELFWKFGGVKNGLQLSEAADGELFDEEKYRRSYDSDFNAPLVNHHIWPCLAQGSIVLVKGEACTKPSSTLVLNRNFCN